VKSILSKLAIALSAGIYGFVAPASATDYPTRPITIITPTAAGGGTDIVARIIAEKIAPVLGQPIVVNNKPGAGGTIGNQAMLREKNDGYTLFVTANSNQLILPWVVKNAGFDPIKDFAPVSGLGVVPYVLAVNKGFPAQTLPEFLTYIKAHPGEVYYASAGLGTLNHLIPEMLASRLDTKLVHVPYKGVSPAMADVLGGQVPVLFGSLSSVLENVKGQNLRALGVSSAQRLDLLPDVPAIAEEVPGFQAEMWVALYALAGTPQPVIDRLSAAVSAALNDPDTQEKFKKQGMSVMKAGPAELAAIQEKEYKMWSEVVPASGASAN
jgi:tripartite-type tricarboxylate transporter receptor subunit TctC